MRRFGSAGCRALSVLLLLSLLRFPAFPGEVPPQEAAASHRRMVEALDRVEQDTMQTNSFLGTYRVEEARAAWERLPPSASRQDRFAAAVGLGVAELDNGREVEAVGLLNAAVRLVINDDGSAGFRMEQLIEAAHSLSIAALRLGEIENCCARPNPDSCLLPLSPRAEHTQRRGSEEAVEHLTQMLDKLTLDEDEWGQAVWMLNVAHMTLGSHPDGVPEPWRVMVDEERVNPPGTPPFPPFPNVAAEAGVNTMSHAGGCIADDLDGDGWPDLLVSSWDPAVPMTFFRNTGKGTFERKEAGLSKIRGGLNLKQADYDNDGDLDILVLRGAWLGEGGYHPNSLLQNDGNANFVDVTYAVGLAEPAFPTQTAEWFDYDLDGDLDLFVGNEGSSTQSTRCQLFRNDAGRFTEVGREAGVAIRGFVKGVTSGDFNGDRYPDLFLSSIRGENLLLRNRGDGTFADARHLIGKPVLPIRSFPAWFFDYDNDGWLDIFVASYDSIGLEHVNYYRGVEMPDHRISALYRNEKGKGFRNVTREVSLDRPMLPMGSNFGDLTNNGYPDLYLGTGTPDYDSIVPNMLFANEGGRFTDRTLSSRTGHLQKGHAVSLVDFDRDGDLDIFEQMGGAVRGDTFYDVLFENPGFGRNWLKVALRGKHENFFGVGARVAVAVDDPESGERWIYQWMGSGGSFGANPLELHFGLGEAERVKRIEVSWPVSGKSQVIGEGDVNRRIVIEEEE